MAVTDRHKSQLAEYLGVSKGYVSQLLNGDYDNCMSKFFELALAFGMVRKEKRIVPIVSIVVKKNKRAKNNPLVLLFIFCFLRFLYNRLFPIRLVFLIVFYILASPNYIVFFPNCLYSAPVNCPIKKMAPVARSFMM